MHYVILGVILYAFLRQLTAIQGWISPLTPKCNAAGAQPPSPLSTRKTHAKWRATLRIGLMRDAKW